MNYVGYAAVDDPTWAHVCVKLTLPYQMSDDGGGCSYHILKVSILCIVKYVAFSLTSNGCAVSDTSEMPVSILAVKRITPFAVHSLLPQTF